jgi:CheY-like chemotaxis protein
MLSNLAKSECPDLIILDLLMPDMNGWVIDTKPKGDLKTKDIPVIFLTCLLQKKEGEEQGRAFSDQVFVAKPYGTERLSSQIERLTNRQYVHRVHR